MTIGAILKSKKARPFIIGGGVLLLGVVLFSLVRGASGAQSAATSSGGPSEALQAAALSANTQTSIAQIQANSQANGVAAQLAAALDSSAHDISLANIAAGSHGQDVDASLQLGMAQLSAQQNIAALTAHTADLGIESQAGVQIAGINAQTLVAQSQFDFLSTQSQLNAARDVDLANISANQNVAIAGISGKTSRANTTASTIGTIAVAALAFFSDSRVKKSITWTGIRDDNVSTYRWEYDSMFDKTPRFGFLAQNVKSVYPQAVKTNWTGLEMLMPNMMGIRNPHDQVM